jgi:hypothetical protein
LKHGDPVRELAERRQYDAQRAAEREAWAAHRQAAEAKEARDKLVAERVAAILAVEVSDRELGADVAGQPPARADLMRTIKRIELAHTAHDQSQIKHDAHLEAQRALDAATAALASLEAEVKAAHDDWHTYGGTGSQPAERLEERAALQQAVSAAQWRADLSAAASDGLMVDVAAAVVTTLQDRLPALRHAVMVEATLPLTLEIADLTAQLRERYSALVALGVVTSTLPKSAKCALPPLPHGQAGFELGAANVTAQIATWRASLEALEGDPNATINVPGFEPEASDEAQAGTWGRLRKAWRDAMN